MNRKEAILVGALLLGTFVASVFADTVTPSTVRGTLQTASVDIEVLKTDVALSGSFFLGLRVRQDVGNLTGAFSFSPNRGFVQTSSVVLTLVYAASQQITLGIKLNSDPSEDFPLTPAGSPFSSSRTVTSQSIHPGANIVNIGATSCCPDAFIFQVRITIEYSFMA